MLLAQADIIPQLEKHVVQIEARPVAYYAALMTVLAIGAVLAAIKALRDRVEQEKAHKQEMKVHWRDDRERAVKFELTVAGFVKVVEDGLVEVRPRPRRRRAAADSAASDAPTVSVHTLTPGGSDGQEGGSD